MAYDPEEDAPEPPQVRRLRILVMALMVVLMLGIVTIAATIVIRLGVLSDGSPLVGTAPLTAEAIALPQGAEITGLGHGAAGVLVSVRRADGSEALRLHDAASGALLRETAIVRD